MMPMKAVSFCSPMKSLSSGGTTRRIAWGSITKRIVLACESPSERAAAVWLGWTLSLNASQFRKVWKNCCTCGRPLSGDRRHRGRVGAEVLLEELVREPLRLQAVDDVVDRGHVRRALVQHGAVLLAGLELADHR